MKDFFFGISVLALLLAGCDDGTSDPSGTGSGKPDATLASKPDVVPPGPVTCPVPVKSPYTAAEMVPRDGYLQVPGKAPCTESASGPTDCSSPSTGFSNGKAGSGFCCVVPPIGSTQASSLYCFGSDAVNLSVMKQLLVGSTALCSPGGEFVGWDCSSLCPSGKSFVGGSVGGCVEPSVSVACPIPVSSLKQQNGGTVATLGYRLLIDPQDFTCSTYPGVASGPTDCSSPVNGFSALKFGDSWCCVNTFPNTTGDPRTATSAYMNTPSLDCSSASSPTLEANVAGKVALCSQGGKFMGWDCNASI